MKLSEIKEILAAGPIHLTKSLGQNFLHDNNQLRRIISAAELISADSVLEIGPGLGALTELLLANAQRVVAIEKDRRLHEWLSRRYQNETRLTLIHGDGLDYVRDTPFDWRAWKLVANLPYSVASPLMVELAQAKHPPSRMTVTVQMEVARRLMAKAGEPTYGVLTLLLQMHYEPADCFRIPPSCFFPAPEVDSACVTLVKRSRPLEDTDNCGVLSRLVKRSFSQRRKMMIKLLKADWPAARLEDAFRRIGLSTQIRAEKVSLEQFAHLARLLTLRPSEPE